MDVVNSRVTERRVLRRQVLSYRTGVEARGVAGEGRDRVSGGFPQEAE